MDGVTDRNKKIVQLKEQIKTLRNTATCAANDYVTLLKEAEQMHRMYIEHFRSIEWQIQKLQEENITLTMNDSIEITRLKRIIKDYCYFLITCSAYTGNIHEDYGRKLLSKVHRIEPPAPYPEQEE